MKNKEVSIGGLRQEVSAIINTLGPGCLMPSREISLARTDAQRAFHNLGLHLQAMGEKTPYQEADNPESKTIEDVKDGTDDFIILKGETQLERVKELRAHIQDTIDSYKDHSFPESTQFANFYQSRMHLIEAKMWLGWELGRIRDKRKFDESGQEMGHSPGLDIKLY